MLHNCKLKKKKPKNIEQNITEYNNNRREEEVCSKAYLEWKFQPFSGNSFQVVISGFRGCDVRSAIKLESPLRIDTRLWLV